MNGKYVRFNGVFLGPVYINPDFITYVSAYNEDPDSPASGVHVIGEKLPIIVKGSPDKVINDIQEQAR